MNNIQRANFRKLCLAILGLFLYNLTQAQDSVGYDPRKLFDPTFFSEPGNSYRDGSGVPGPQYWQNRADYKISARLEIISNSISGSVEINYTNNSPNNLSYLWLQMDQNRFEKNSIRNMLKPYDPEIQPNNPNYQRNISYLENPHFKGGFNVKSVRIEFKNQYYSPDFYITDTRMKINLPIDLVAKGGKIKVMIDYDFEVPKSGDRMGKWKSKKGNIFEIGQWYPRMCVYDDVQGWNALPYIEYGEFYLEYGDFDYTVTAPSNYTVVGSGTLQNPEQVLSLTQRQRLEQARNSDSTVYIIKPGEIIPEDTARYISSTKTWHFKIENSRDAAWAASPVFVWDAAKMNMPSGRKILAQSFYPLESSADTAWGSSTQCIKSAIEFNSKQWFEYPYSNAVNVAGGVGGMEYPGIVFCSKGAYGEGMWNITNHEFGHNWFPMIVGSNERKHAWMDEGFTGFINKYATEHFKDNKYGYPDSTMILSMTYEMFENIENINYPVLSYADAMPFGAYFVNAYPKPETGLIILRDYIIGPKRFDEAFKRYIKFWAFKHPTPKDFFRVMNDATGENLDWFWKGWFCENYKLDQAVKEVKYVDKDLSLGAVITIVNNKQMAMPVTVKVEESNGKSGILKFPVEIWASRSEFSFKYNSTSNIVSVTIDPNIQFPDINRYNNVWSISK